MPPGDPRRGHEALAKLSRGGSPGRPRGALPPGLAATLDPGRRRRAEPPSGGGSRDGPARPVARGPARSGHQGQDHGQLDRARRPWAGLSSPGPGGDVGRRRPPPPGRRRRSRPHLGSPRPPGRRGHGAGRLDGAGRPPQRRLLRRATRPARPDRFRAPRPPSPGPHAPGAVRRHPIPGARRRSRASRALPAGSFAFRAAPSPGRWPGWRAGGPGGSSASSEGGAVRRLTWTAPGPPRWCCTGSRATVTRGREALRAPSGSGTRYADASGILLRFARVCLPGQLRIRRSGRGSVRQHEGRPRCTGGHA